MSTRVDGATVLVLVSARATLSAGPVHMALSASEGPAPGTWRYNLHDGQQNRAAYGRAAGTPTTWMCSGTPQASAQPDTSPEPPNVASWNNSPPAPDTLCRRQDRPQPRLGSPLP